MKTKLTFVALAGLVASMCMEQSMRAAENVAPTPSPGTSSVLPRPDFHFPGNVGRTYLDSDKPQFPQPVRAPKGAPNIVLILIDDAGFGQFSTFGGGVPSPTMDKLAAEGLRFNRFHTTALCSPTRAALITGRNHQSAAFGGITELATGYDGYLTIEAFGRALPALAAATKIWRDLFPDAMGLCRDGYAFIKKSTGA